MAFPDPLTLQNRDVNFIALFCGHAFCPRLPALPVARHGGRVLYLPRGDPHDVDGVPITSVGRRSPLGRAAIGIVRLRLQGYLGNVDAEEILGMARGTVKWFNSQKGYGFIQPQGGGGKDVFVHISAVEKAGLSGLDEGQIVEYEEVANKGKTSAENLKVQR